MEPCRTSAISEFDAPSARVSRDVSTYLTFVVDEQVRYVDALANATALLADHDGGLAAAAALQVRLAQQFVDAQRSILRMWADTDAKVSRITEAATLEAAVLGLRVDGLIDLDHAVDTSCEHELRRLLERSWEVARLDGLRAIEQAHSATDHWLQVARLASDETSDDDAPVLADVADEGALDEVVGSTPSLPVPVAAVLTGHSERGLIGLLDELWDLLAEPDDEVARPTAEIVPASAADPVRHDGFDGFWTGAPAAQTASGRRERRIVRDALAPMFVLVTLLVLVLAAIG